MESWKHSGLVVGVVIAAIVFGGWLQAWSLDHAPGKAPAPVLVWDHLGAPVTFAAPRDAFTYASSLAGFRVAGPTYLPPGYALVEIDVPAKPTPPAAPPIVSFTILNGNAGFHIFVLNLEVSSLGDPSHVQAAASAVKALGLQNSTCSFIAPAREVCLERGIPSPLTDAEAVRILASLTGD